MLTLEWIDFGFLPSDFLLQDFMVPRQNYGNLLEYRVENGKLEEIKNILRNGKLVSSEAKFARRIKLLEKEVLHLEKCPEEFGRTLKIWNYKAFRKHTCISDTV